MINSHFSREEHWQIPKLIYLSNHSNEISVKLQSDNTGSWEFRPPIKLAPGNHTITIKSVDASGILQTLAIHLLYMHQEANLLNHVFLLSPPRHHQQQCCQQAHQHRHRFQLLLPLQTPTPTSSDYSGTKPEPLFRQPKHRFQKLAALLLSLERLRVYQFLVLALYYSLHYNTNLCK